MISRSIVTCDTFGTVNDFFIAPQGPERLNNSERFTAVV